MEFKSNDLVKWQARMVMYREHEGIDKLQYYTEWTTWFSRKIAAKKEAARLALVIKRKYGGTFTQSLQYLYEQAVDDGDYECTTDSTDMVIRLPYGITIPTDVEPTPLVAETSIPNSPAASETFPDLDEEDHTDDSRIGMGATSAGSGIRSATMSTLVTMAGASSVPVINNDINNTNDLSWILLKLALVLTTLTIGWMIWLRLSNHQLPTVHQGMTYQSFVQQELTRYAAYLGKWRVRCKGNVLGSSGKH